MRCEDNHDGDSTVENELDIFTWSPVTEGHAMTPAEKGDGGF